MNVFLTLRVQLEMSERIIHITYFETGLVRILKGERGKYCLTGKRAMQKILLSSSIYFDQDELTVLIKNKSAVKKRLQEEDPQERSVYLITKFLVATSNLFELLFNKARNAMTNRRHGILPSTLFGNEQKLWKKDEVKKNVH